MHGDDVHFHTILQVLSLSLFDRTPILQAFAEANSLTETKDSAIELSLLQIRWDSTELLRLIKFLQPT